MGVLIPLFKKSHEVTGVTLNVEQQTRLKLLENSMEALRREEESIERIIDQKCKEEISRLRTIDMKRAQLEAEIGNLKKTPQGRSGSL